MKMPAMSRAVILQHEPYAGPGRIVPRQARQLLIVPRNTETLRRLGLIAEGSYRESTQPR